MLVSEPMFTNLQCLLTMFQKLTITLHSNAFITIHLKFQRGINK